MGSGSLQIIIIEQEVCLEKDNTYLKLSSVYITLDYDPSIIFVAVSINRIIHGVEYFALFRAFRLCHIWSI